MNRREAMDSMTKAVAKTAGFDMIREAGTKEVLDVHLVGKIDRNIYKCITDDILTACLPSGGPVGGPSGRTDG